jgi:hypothetical protein
MKFTTALLAIATLAAGVSAQVTVKTIINNGASSNRYDIVILGDGYQSTEQTKFNNDCTAVLNKLFATEPYKTFKPFFNAHTVFRASKDSGADHPDKIPPIVKDTVYDASYNTGGTPRCLYIKNTSQASKDAALAPAVEGRIMVIVNDSRYGGCAGTFAVTYNGSSMTNVQVHEFGHSFARVADEYDYPNTTYTGGEPSQKNVTKDPTGKAKWPLWIGFNGVSAFEGAKYYKYGLYRPVSNCIMRSLGRPVCPVCGEQVVIYSYKTVSAIDKPVPAATIVAVNQGTKQFFSFTNIAPASGNAVTSWKVDRATQSSTSNVLLVDTSGMSYGDHQVVAQVVDKTAYVRNDPANDLVSTRAWTLRINTPKLADLYALWLPLRAGVPAGTSLQLDTWVQNIGTAASPTVRVDHFLSTDPIFTSADVYLGGYNQSGLNPSEVMNTSRSSVNIPAHVRPGNYYLGMVIDRTNVVKELNENNNVHSFAITIKPAACTAYLSYNDPLNYPPTAGAVNATTGGVLHPVVTARCNIGDSYLILLGCSGTSPGTALPPSLTLPLNIDACTDVLYRGIGSPFLLGFLGKIDAQGFGRARLTVPSGLPGMVNGHFASVIFDSTTGAFKRVTNAVNFTFK